MGVHTTLDDHIFQDGLSLMIYGDEILVNHIKGRLDPELSAEIDDEIHSSTIGGELHERYWKLQVWDAVRSKKSYAKHICGEHRSGSAEEDAEDLIVIAFEKLRRLCEKAELHKIKFRDGAYDISDGTGKPKEANGIRPLQCRLQILEFENAGKTPTSFKIDGAPAPIELGAAPFPAAKIAYRFFEVCTHRITTEPSKSDWEQLSISVLPLKFLLRKTIRNLSSDLYLRKLTPKEREQAQANYDGDKPRFASKSDGLESLGASTDFEGGEVSEESLLNQQQIEEMRRSATDHIEMREEAREVMDFIQSDQINSDFRSALLLFLSGVSYADIAKQEDIPQATARTRVCRARMALAKAFPELHESLKAHRASSGASTGLGE